MIRLRNSSDELMVCLIGAPDDERLAAEVGRIAAFLDHAPQVFLRDVAYTAGLTARRMPCVLGVVAGSTEDLRDRLKIAHRKLIDGTARIRDKAGAYYFRGRLRPEGKIAFVYPGASSYHPEMLRDVSLLFPLCRQAFDELEEGLEGLCGEGGAGEILFAGGMRPAAPAVSDPVVLSTLAMSGAYAASAVFTDLLRRIGVPPDGVAGVGVGAFSALSAAGVTGDLPRGKRVQMIRGSGQMIARLAERRDIPSVSMMSVDRLPVARVEEVVGLYPGRMVVAHRMTPEYTVVCLAPDILEEVARLFQAEGATTLVQTMTSPFNTPWCAKAVPLFNQFFSRWLRHAPRLPIYSTVSAGPVDSGLRELQTAVIDQLTETVRLEETINRMYDDGYRIFVEAGARGTLSMLIGQILGNRPHLAVAANRFHRPGMLQMCHAVAQLAAHGIPVDLTQLDDFRGAQLLDFDVPMASASSQAAVMRLDSALPLLRPEQIPDSMVELLAVPAETPGTADAEPQRCLRRNDFGSEFPMLVDAQVVHAEPGVLIELSKRIHLEDYPFLRDFSLGTSRLSFGNPQLRGLTLFSVPASLETMAEAALRLAPAGRVIQVESIRAQRWLGFERDEVNITVRAERVAWDVKDQCAVKVQLRDDSPNSAFTWPIVEAIFVIAAEMPAPQPMQPRPLMNPRPVNWSGRAIYPDRLFQGPLLRSVQHVDGWSEEGIDYEIEVPSRAQTVRYTPVPLFACAPLVLDGVMSGFPLWRSHERFEGAISFPFRARSIRFCASSFPEGMRLKVYLRLANVTPRSLVVDISVSDGHGNLLLQVKGWEELSSHVPRRLHDFVMRPAEHFVTDPLPPGLLPSTATMVAGAVIQDYSVPFYVANQELWLKTLAMAVLSPAERDEWLEMRGAAGRRLEWLLGRVAAKESVRRHLLDHHHARWASADVTVWADDSGKPHPLGPWRDPSAPVVDLSIAHTSTLIIAAVAANARIGIDIERIGRDLSEEFTRGVFTIEDQELATHSGAGPTAMLRFWCAKEALSKALGTGIRYSPTDLRIRKADPATGQVEIELMGQWLEPFPAFKGRLIPIRTGVFANHAIASCILPYASVQQVT